MSRVTFDPDVGYMLQPNLADHPVSDFQHWLPWRRLVVATATELARFTGQHLIAPRTVLDRGRGNRTPHPCRSRRMDRRRAKAKR